MSPDKTITLALSAYFVTAASMPAQDSFEQPNAGILQVVNMISLKSPTFIALDDFEFNRGDPITTGGDSGLLPIRPGEFSLTLRNEAAEPPEHIVPISMEARKSIIVIAWDEEKVFGNGDTEIKLRSTVLAEAPELTRPRVSLVSLAPEATLLVQVDGSPISLTPKTVVHRDVGMDTTVQLTQESTDIIDIEITRVANYLVFLYRDPDSGELGATLIQNEKLEYQPPEEEEETDEE